MKTILSRYKNNTLWLFLIVIMCFVSCSSDSKEEEFEIIYTTDVHGALLDADFMQHDKETVSLANVMTYVSQARNSHDREVILLDNGDLIQGDPSMYYYNFQAIREEHLAARVCNYMQYNAINLGNHDFECGEGVYYDHFPKQLHCPLLGANCVDTRTNKPMFEPYIVIKKGDYKIVVLGITNPGVTQWLPRSMYPHIEFISMSECARLWIPRLRKQINPDMMVVMFHAGHEEPEFEDSHGVKFIDGVKQVVAENEGIDLVLIGHDHKFSNEKIATFNNDSVPLVQPKPFAQQFASIKFSIDRNRKPKIQFHNILLQDSWRYAPDFNFCKTFQGAVDSINAYLDTPLGQLADTLYGREVLVGQTNLMDFIHSVQLSRTNAEISMACALGSFLNIPAGNITMRQLFDIYKYENQIYKVWMTGYEVQRFLDYGYSRQFTHMQSASDHLLGFRLDDKGEIIMGNFGPELVTPQYNFTSAAGINYVVDVTKPEGKRVKIESMADGSPFQLDHRYIVVLSSFQISGGGGFLTKGLGWSPQDIRFHAVGNGSTKDMRYFIAHYIKENGIVKSHACGHWKVVPEEWWQSNKNRDLALILPHIRR